MGVSSIGEDAPAIRTNSACIRALCGAVVCDVW